MEHRLIIKKVVAEGFGSIGNSLSFDFDVKGIHIIKGQNGAGKTTIFNALCWALYGVSLKGVTSANVVTWKQYRPETFKGTRVLVYFEVEGGAYCIARHYKYKDPTFGVVGGYELMIFSQDGEQYSLTSEVYKRDTQSEIDRLLGMDYRVFVNSVLFGQRMTRLISATGQAKRELFEEIFDTSFVNAAREKAKEEQNELQTKVVKLERDISHNLQKHQIYTKQLDDSKNMLSEFEATTQAKIERTKAQIAKDNEVLAAHKANLKAAQDKHSGLELEVAKLEKALASFDDSDLILIREQYAKVKVTLSETETKIEAQKKILSSLKYLASTSEENLVKSKRLESRLTEAYETKIAELKAQKAKTETTCQACGKPIDPDKLQGVLDGFDKASLKVMETYKTEFKEAADNSEYQQAQIDKATPLLEPQQKLINDLETERKGLLDSLAAYKLREQQQAEGYVSLEADFKVAKSNLNINTKEISYCEQHIKDVANGIAAVEQHLEDLKQATPPHIDLDGLQTNLTTLETENSEITQQLNTLKEDLAGLEFWSKKGFGAMGVGSFIFARMLQQLNFCTKTYAEMVGLGIEMGVDVSLPSKPFFTNVLYDGAIVEYKELSGGEQQLVDICIAFGVHDLISKRLPLLILDEVFEGLDPNNIGKVFEFVRTKMEAGRTIFIITHMAELDFTYCKTIEVSKESHNTVLVWD